MPLYEYECSACSHRFELRRSFTDESNVCCPKCEANAIRIYSPVPIIFKGSGFYVTDHKSKNGSSEPVTSSSETKTADSVKAASSSPSSEK